MTDCRHSCTFCHRLVISIWFGAVLVAASTTFAQVLVDDEGPQPPADSTAAKRTAITGRVLDAKGAPIGNAEVVIVTSEYARSARPTGVYINNALPMSFAVVGPVQTDGQGKFQLDVPGSHSGVYAGLGIYAAARGHGCVTQYLGQMAGQQPVELTLGPEHVVRGRLIDLKGQPVAGVNVRVVMLGWRPPATLEIWKPMTTDDKGRFLIRGLGPEKITLQIEGEQFTPQQSDAQPVPVGSNDHATFSLAPGKCVHGRITFADTGKPAANAAIVVPAAHVGDPRWVESRTDEGGNYSIYPFAPDEKWLMGGPKNYFVNVFPPRETGYLVSHVEVPLSRAAAQEVNIRLQRGILVRGRVTEMASGSPVAGARVQYTARRDYMAGSIEPSRLDTAITSAGGDFELAVPADPGHLLVLGPTLDYCRVETSAQETQATAGPGGVRYYADAVVPVNFKPATARQPFEIKLRRGVRLKGRVVGPNNKPVPDFVLFSRPYLVSGYSYNYGEGNFLKCHNGEFELPGCDPDKTHLVYLYDRTNHWGATAELSRQHEREAAVVRLEPCGSAEARFIDADGKPRAQYRPQFACVLTDGAPRRFYQGDRHDYPLEADLINVFQLDPKAFRAGLQTNDDGRVVFPVLIPGARYMIHWPPQDFTDNAPWPHLVFTVRAGEKKNLGEIVMKGQVTKGRVR